MKKEMRPKKARNKVQQDKKANSRCKDHAAESKKETQESSHEAPVEEYFSPEFTQRLLEHMNKAVKAALSEGKEKAE